ncbi:MAG: glycoside hydrolase family 3 N-terminal domain-containing protein [Deltaproteobacteria bacterium]|nr:glycoside hydrolase family 3 N-terminal domain-containing protein [Deltaproteobacteria bacterium]
MLNVKEKAAQLIVPRLDGNRLGDEEYFNHILNLIDEGIGGFILFGGKAPDTPEAVSRLQEKARIPLLITSDIERGLGQQLTGGTKFPSQWAVAEAIDRNNPADVALLHKMLTAVSEECAATGIHAVFSPVADVNVNPDNPIICTRSFGEEPEKVSWFVAEYVKGLQKRLSTDHRPLATDHFLLACAKHFPGHGDTAVDSHTSLPIINAGRERLERVELPPFRAAINAGVGMIMIGHLMVPALEPEPIPATFSRRIVTNLLREEMGFKGLIVTDALDMGALKSICDEGEAAVRCLEAGCDILLHPSEPLKVLEVIVKAVEEGRLSFDRVEEAYGRVMGIKNQWSVAGGQWPEIGTHQSKDIADRIARKAIKFRKGRGVSQSENMACIIIDDDGDGSLATPFLDDMKDRFPGFKIVSSTSEIKKDETVIIPIFSRVSAWKGSSGLSKDSFEKVKSIIDRAGQAVLISFGSPYILNSFDADVMIDAFDPADFMQRAVAERLKCNAVHLGV